MAVIKRLLTVWVIASLQNQILWGEETKRDANNTKIVVSMDISILPCWRCWEVNNRHCWEEAWYPTETSRLNRPPYDVSESKADWKQEWRRMKKNLVKDLIIWVLHVGYHIWFDSHHFLSSGVYNIDTKWNHNLTMWMLDSQVTAIQRWRSHWNRRRRRRRRWQNWRCPKQPTKGGDTKPY